MRGAQTIDFAGIAPVTDTVAAVSLTINGTAGSDAIAVTDGGLVGGFQTTQISAPSFESIRFANKTSVTIDGNGGVDTLTFNNPTPATGLATFNVVNVGAVTQTGAVNYTNLSLNVTGAVTLTGNNDVTNLAAVVTGAGNGFAFNDVDDITLTSVGGMNGFSTHRWRDRRLDRHRPHHRPQHGGSRRRERRLQHCRPNGGFVRRHRFPHPLGRGRQRDGRGGRAAAGRQHRSGGRRDGECRLRKRHVGCERALGR